MNFQFSIFKSQLPIVHDLGLTDYNEVFLLQKKIVSDKIAHQNKQDIILLVEHFPVFTLGKRGGMSNLIVSKEFLKSKKIKIIQTQRGGNITFHGPGQLVVYPIINLRKLKIGVADFVNFLEQIMLETCLDFGIKAHRNNKNHGIWVKKNKIGSLGLSIKKGISFHGFSLNIDMSLKPFTWINPCGIKQISMTSIKNELKKNNKSHINIDMKKIKQSIIKNFSI
ncbi:MAG: hypothetical protein B6I26_05745 [Desulfobacteraceae bacterium 4572_130]|nr:MAG: hypothetical protein B6I26_05745 [Desulfobacteraceae bacterium 4572_130]